MQKCIVVLRCPWCKVPFLQYYVYKAFMIWPVVPKCCVSCIKKVTIIIKPKTAWTYFALGMWCILDNTSTWGHPKSKSENHVNTITLKVSLAWKQMMVSHGKQGHLKSTEVNIWKFCKQVYRSARMLLITWIQTTVLR